MAALMIWAVCAGAAVVILLCRLQRLKREVNRFTEQMAQWLDDVMMEKEIERPATDTDTLESKFHEKICQIQYVFRRKKEETIREKAVIKELISDISHQTKTPMTNMKLYLDMLKDEPLSDKGRGFLADLDAQTDKLDFLFQSMVKMSRMETGVLRIQRDYTSLLDTLGSAVAAIVPKAEGKQIQLFVQCEEDIMISHDKKWTEEAIFNILDNAVKYTDVGGRIEINVSVLEIYTRISIRDSGKGIAPERQAEIFNRFYREPEVSDKEGIGIGLYLARKIIEMQNGYIEVRSQIGQGSDFQIYLMNQQSQ